MSPSKKSKDYGEPFLQIFKEADHDFSKNNHNLFAPAILTINNVKNWSLVQGWKTEC